MNGQNFPNNLNQNTNLGGAANVSPSAPAFPAVKRNNKKIILGVAIGLAVVLGVAAVVLATGLWNPMWNPFRPSPEKVLDQAFENTGALETMHSQITLTMSAQDGEEANVQGIINIDVDARDESNLKWQTTLDLSIFAQGIEMLFNGEASHVDHITYFKIDTIPFVLYGELAMMGINIEDWRAKWFKWDSSELGMSLGLGKISKEDEAALEKEMQALSDKYPVIKVKKELPSEAIDGVKNYHYLLVVDKENFKPFMSGFLEILNKYYQSGIVTQITDEEKQEMFKSIDEAFNAVGELSFEIWIGQKDILIYKIAGEKLFDLSKMGQGQEGKVNIGFESLNSKFNQPVVIEVPQDAKSIIEMLAPLIDQMSLGSAQISASNSKLKVYLAQLREIAQLVYYNDDYSYKSLCSLQKLNINHSTQGQSLKDVANDVAALNLEITCFATDSAFCVSVKLLGNKGFSCADSAGVFKDSQELQNPCTVEAKCK